MMKNTSLQVRANEANFNSARRMIGQPVLEVRPIALCGNCGLRPAVVSVGITALYRCQPCANHLVNLWNEMRSESDD